MMKLGIYVGFISIFLIFSIRSMPVVEAYLPGLLGNRFFAFCLAKIVAKKLKFKLCSRSIEGFPNTYKYKDNLPKDIYPTENIVTGHDLDLESLINNKSLRNIRLEGYFQRYKYFKPYAKRIRDKWLKIDPSLLTRQDPNDIVLHIRTNYETILPFEYYKKALSQATYNRVFICTDEPQHPFLDNFKAYNPIIKSKRSLSELLITTPWDEIAKINLDDFAFIYSFNKIIISNSTFAWWAGFLSNATEVYAPNGSVYGNVEEERYHYIDTTVGHY